MWYVIEDRGRLMVVQYPPEHANVHARYDTEQGAENYRARMERWRRARAKKHYPFAMVGKVLLAMAVVWAASSMIPGGW